MSVEPETLNIWYLTEQGPICCAKWDMNILYKKFSTKCPALAIIDANMIANTVKFTAASLFISPTFSKFYTALATGKISIDFRARTGRDHGVAFRIQRRHLRWLFTDQHKTRLASA